MTPREPLISRLKLAVMTPFVVFVLILAGSVATIEYQKFRHESTRISLEIASAIDTSFRASVGSEAAMLQAVAASIANDDALKAAFRQRDRARLLAKTGSLFLHLKTTNQITHLYFTDTSRVNILRVHQPERHGDVIDRRTTLEAERTHVPVHGIELGPLGTLTLRVVVPWYDGNELLGYIETGKEIDHLFDSLRQQFDLQPLVFLPKARLNRAGWEGGMAMLGRPAEWDEFEDVVLSTRSGIPSDIIRPFLVGRQDNVKTVDHWYSWLRVNVPDASGDSAATIGLVRDVTAAHEDILRMGLLIAGIAVFGSAVLIALFWLVIGRVEAQLKRANAEVARREALFHELFSRARVAMLLIDPADGSILDASAEAEQFYGYDHVGLTGLHISDISVLSREEMDRETALAQAQGRNHIYARHRLANGDVRDVEDHSAPIRVGERTLIYSIIHDVTDRRQLEQERKRLVLAIEQAPVSIIITDPAGIIEYANPAFSRATGYSREEFVGANPRILKSGEMSADEYAAMWADLTAGKVWEGVFHNKRKNGELYWEQAHISPVLDPWGGITHYIAVKEDITARRRDEQALKENEERFRSLVEGTSDWIWETDDNHRFTWFSPSVEAVLGVPAASLIGTRRWDLASDQEIDSTRWEGYIADLAALRRFRDFRYWLKSENGHAKWVSISGAPRFDENGQFLGYRGTGADVSAFVAVSLRLRTMSKVVEQSPISVVITDPAGLITYVNPHFSVSTGYASKEVLGRNSNMLSSGETPPQTYGELWGTITSGETWTGELKNRRKDGGLHWEQVLIFPVINDEGQLVHFVSIKEDVTDRKEAQVKLVEQMALTQHHYESLRALSEIAALPWLDIAESLNAALTLGCQHLGLPMGIISRVEAQSYTVRHHHAADDVGLADSMSFDLGDTYCSITLDEGRVVAIPHMTQSSHAGHPCYAAFAWETYIGAPVIVRNRCFGTICFSSVDAYGRAFDEGDQEFMRLLAQWVAAVLERGRAEQEVRDALEVAEKARSRTDLILSSAGEGIFGVDTAGHFVFANPATQRMLGYTDEDAVIGQSTHAVTGHRQSDGFPCAVDDCAVTSALRDGIARRSDTDAFQRRDGETFPVELSVTAMTEHDAITGAVVVFHDITERREAEQALADALGRIERQASELSAINGELEQFAYVASHDLRQPLRMVSSYLSLIDKKLGKDLPEDLKKFFGFAIDGARRMDRLILDLLEYSRTGRNAAPVENLPLAEVVADSLLNLEVAIREVEATVTVAEGLPMVTGDRVELVRLFQNLVGNAVKYRAPERKPVVDIGWRAEGRDWLLWVRDNGIGMAPENHDRAFQIFQRLVAREQYEGTGIGLAVCKKIVANHGGRIWIESALGEGSVFYVAFPRSDKGPAKRNAAPATSASEDANGIRD
jgi:PAS domain S-box-containing protein